MEASAFKLRKVCQKRRLAASSSKAGLGEGRRRPEVLFVHENHTLGSAAVTRLPGDLAAPLRSRGRRRPGCDADR